jgi:four helix bundle protein
MDTGFRDLLVWQEAMNLAVMVYRITSHFPKEETYSLTAQARRSAVSIPSNIAEGDARNSSREQYHLLGVAAGSLAELETQLELAARLEYLRVDPATTRQLQRVGMLLHALRRSRKTKRSG